MYFPFILVHLCWHLQNGIKHPLLKHSGTKLKSLLLDITEISGK